MDVIMVSFPKFIYTINISKVFVKFAWGEGTLDTEP